jgi:hypothetical protein
MDDCTFDRQFTDMTAGTQFALIFPGFVKTDLELQSHHNALAGFTESKSSVSGA